MPKDGALTATLWRMDMAGHTCPYGLKSKALLERQGFAVDDRRLTSREETEAFKARHGVETTPQAWLGEERVGGYDDLRIRFGLDDPEDDGTSYQPVLAIFAVAGLLALAVAWAATGGFAEFGAWADAGAPAAGSVSPAELLSIRVLEWFVAIAMVLLGLQKLQDVESFSTMFLNYDLLARRWVRYGKVYPFAETGAGLLMVAGTMIWLAAPVALFIGTVGAVSVIKAVYVEGRELRCACVGGASRVPLGFLSLTENLMMMAMAVWMLAKPHLIG